MSKRQILILLGIWVMAFLFLGFPGSFDKVIALLTGVIIIAVSYSIRFPEQVRSDASKEQIPYVEHKNDPITNPSTGSTGNS